MISKEWKDEHFVELVSKPLWFFLLLLKKGNKVMGLVWAEWPLIWEVLCLLAVLRSQVQNHMHLNNSKHFLTFGSLLCSANACVARSGWCRDLLEWGNLEAYCLHLWKLLSEASITNEQIVRAAVYIDCHQYLADQLRVSSLKWTHLSRKLVLS